MARRNLADGIFTNQPDQNIAASGWFLAPDTLASQRAGDDLIAATGGAEGELEGILNEGTIVGGAGNDTISATSTGVPTLFGLFGVGLFNRGWINGGADNDVVHGYVQELNDGTGIINEGGTIAGGAGNDSIFGEVLGLGIGIGIANYGLLDGGPGRDTITPLCQES